MDRYPSLKDQIHEKLSFAHTNDLFERKIEFIRKKRLRLTGVKLAEFNQRVNWNSAILREIVYAREVPGFRDDDEEAAVEAKGAFVAFLHRRVFNWGPEDFDLPFFYFSSELV